MSTANLLVRFLLELCALTALGCWGAHTGDAGTLTAPEPLFPRLETETASD